MSLNNSRIASIMNSVTGANCLQLTTACREAYVAPSVLSLPPNSPSLSIGSSSSIDLLASSEDDEDTPDKRDCLAETGETDQNRTPSDEARVPLESSRVGTQSETEAFKRDTSWDFLPRRRKFEEIERSACPSSSSSIDLEADNSENDEEVSEFSDSNLHGRQHQWRQSYHASNSASNTPLKQQNDSQAHQIPTSAIRNETNSRSTIADNAQPDTLYNIQEHTRIVIDRFPVAFHLPDALQDSLNETQRKQLPIAPKTVPENPAQLLKESTTEALIGIPQNIIFENGRLNAKLVKLMSDSKLKLDQFDHLCKKMRTATGWVPPEVEGCPPRLKGAPRG
ncbi:hypothetical protein BJ741DRAFT_592811 [Chytriomyces cf. hyalinus JEL632]|nr:hypothetical protein BJ741DRAFT_592811 [Chytriomyces cf. hyalinus JEL632]